MIQNKMTAKKVKMKTTVGCVAEFSQPMTHLITNKTVIFIVKNVMSVSITNSNGRSMKTVTDINSILILVCSKL